MSFGLEHQFEWLDETIQRLKALPGGVCGIVLGSGEIYYALGGVHLGGALVSGQDALEFLSRLEALYSESATTLPEKQRKTSLGFILPRLRRQVPFALLQNQNIGLIFLERTALASQERTTVDHELIHFAQAALSPDHVPMHLTNAEEFFRRYPSFRRVYENWKKHPFFDCPDMTEEVFLCEAVAYSVSGDGFSEPEIVAAYWDVVKENYPQRYAVFGVSYVDTLIESYLSEKHPKQE
jgi:hypothetical protein